jgi:Arc/MetJ-type ribon-helix-helix transcriptional regulator
LSDKSELVDLPKLRLQITVREDLVKWIDEQVKRLRFANRSHAIEFALANLKENGHDEKNRHAKNQKKAED